MFGRYVERIYEQNKEKGQYPNSKAKLSDKLFDAFLAEPIYLTTTNSWKLIKNFSPLPNGLEKLLKTKK